MIEKKIHYCWFGGGEKNSLINNCIASWVRHMPEYEIIEWNETNCNYSNQFLKDAYRNKKWAFVSDYIRLKVLFEMGGIYLDIDMFAIKSLNPLLTNNCFLGRQLDGQINGSIIGAIKGNAYIANCISIYDKALYRVERLMSMAIPIILTSAYDNFEDKEAIQLFPPDVFYPYSFQDSLRGKNFMNSVNMETYMVHLWNASWFSEKEWAGFAFEERNYFKGFRLLMVYYFIHPKAIFNIPKMLLRNFIKTTD